MEEDKLACALDENLWNSLQMLSLVNHTHELERKCKVKVVAYQ